MVIEEPKDCHLTFPFHSTGIMGKLATFWIFSYFIKWDSKLNKNLMRIKLKTKQNIWQCSQNYKSQVLTYYFGIIGLYGEVFFPFRF